MEFTVTCAACGQQNTEVMPTDACRWLYECAGCRTLIRPKPRDCSVPCKRNPRYLAVTRPCAGD
ncbi:GDCCVxC domain-containing (seleno)protein [Aquisalimonas sp.]|uniref:GDCCVxC domain-containing (seleno)protein n=1 Tax=Aquisalimonas sp. TaxID=1872621 RepID=UPI0025C209AC|nr:GDCCVxC domain-containing (seleno)protein [Aquisalimonas sp.]